MNFLVLICNLFFILAIVDGTLSPTKGKKAKKQKPPEEIERKVSTAHENQYFVIPI